MAHWILIQRLGTINWQPLMRALEEHMITLGMQSCKQIITQAAHSGHSVCLIVAKAAIRRPDFNWIQIMEGKYDGQGAEITCQMPSALQAEWKLWGKKEMEELRDNPYGAFSTSHQGIASKIKNLGYLR